MPIQLDTCLNPTQCMQLLEVVNLGRAITISIGDSGDGKSSAPTPQPQLTDWGNS